MLQCTKPGHANCLQLQDPASRHAPGAQPSATSGPRPECEQVSSRPAGACEANETFQMENTCYRKLAHPWCKHIIRSCLRRQKHSVAQRGDASGAGPAAQAPSTPEVNAERGVWRSLQKSPRGVVTQGPISLLISRQSEELFGLINKHE